MNDNQHGEGSYYAVDGTIKTGIWKDGTYQGKTDVINGCIYGDCSSGYGTYVWESGEKYVGNWTNNRRNGQGTNYFVNGERYEGEWKGSLKHGNGADIFANGDIYIGQYKFGTKKIIHFYRQTLWNRSVHL